MTRTKELLNQIIEMAKVQAIELDKYNILIHKAMRTVGDNPVVFHLDLLKELIEIESKELLAKKSQEADTSCTN